MLEKFEWKGAEYKVKVAAKAAELLLRWGDMVAAEAKSTVHRVTGTLSRSIATFAEARDTAAEERPDIGSLAKELEHADKATILVGSKLPYACVEENRHPYLGPAVSKANSMVKLLAERVFAQL